MKLILFGTGPFAVPTFESLIQSSHEILALVTRPITDSGKRRKIAENPARDLGLQNELKIFDPASANDRNFVDTLANLKADLFVVCDYGQILSRKCLAASRLGGINLHGSLLPKYRGAAPINWAIYNGEKQTGITIIHMTNKLDGGPCLRTATMEIEPTATTEDIEPQLAALGVAAVDRSIELLEAWDGVSLIGEKQDPTRATQAPRLKKSDGLIDWNRSAVQIVNQIRAFQPWPGSFTTWTTEKLKQPLRLIVHRAEAADAGEETDAIMKLNPRPGTVVISDLDRLLIQTGSGLLSICRIQPAGKREMAIQEFLRGNQPAIGESFGIVQ